MWMLSACGDIGLVASPDDHVVSAGAPGDSAEEVEEAAPRVQAGLAGRTYRVDLTSVQAVQPSGLSALMATSGSDFLLFHVLDESADELSMVVTLAASDGRQNPCEPVQSLPTADWSGNPRFSIERGSVGMRIGGEDVTLYETRLAATVAEDATLFSDGDLEATIDTRELGDALGETDVCELVEAMDGSCTACDDGAVRCVEVILAEIIGVEVNFGFDPENDGSSC